MKTIAIVSRKGGVGKSTLTMNCAIAASDSTIIDTDPQASCADWGDRRQGKPPEIMTVPAGRIQSSLKRCQTEWIFVDTQPSAEASLIEIAKAADICVIVLRPGQLELDALGATLAAIYAVQANAVFCINQVHPQANLSDLVESLSEYYPVGPLVRSRVDFATAVIEGLTAIEWKPDGKAAEEIKNYWQWLQEQMNNA